MPFQPFDLGRVIQTAESIKGMRRQSTLDALRERYLGEQIQSAQQAREQGQTRFEQQQTQFTQDQQIENTRLLNAAMAEIAQDVNAADRWVPILKERGVVQPDFDWRSQSPEQVQQGAQAMFESTSKALQAYNQGGTSTGMVQSTFLGGNGNAWIVTRDGRTVDTGVPMQRFSPRALEVGGGLEVFDPNVQRVTGQIATPDQQIGAAARQAGAEQSARERAKIEAIQPRAQAERAAQAPQRAEKLQLITTNIDSTLAEVDRALSNTSLWTAGALGSLVNAVPGTPAYDLNQTLLTVKANLGFDRLQAMRDASPTGGALGQVAVQELAALQASVASLDQRQSPEQLRANLIKVQNHYNNWKRAVQAANQDLAPQSGQTSAQGPAQIQSDADYDALPSGAEFIAPDGTRRRKP